MQSCVEALEGPACQLLEGKTLIRRQACLLPNLTNLSIPLADVHGFELTILPILIPSDTYVRHLFAS